MALRAQRSEKIDDETTQSLLDVGQAVLDTLHVTFFDQSYVTSVEAMADNFFVGF